uniref:BHLH domain-containing protein n=1 Tax=Timema genevievae TaxID=629358 RepID=A0A7R9K341_TIMGE|nr:unnamed protein product [Timema genevievae]
MSVFPLRRDCRRWGSQLFLKSSVLSNIIMSPLMSFPSNLLSGQFLAQAPHCFTQHDKATTDSNNNNDHAKDIPVDEPVLVDTQKEEKYSLRPRSTQKRIQTEEIIRAVSRSSRKRNGGGSRPKQKPPPLSKYRRKTANARERDRMREINVAFESLRRAVPHVSLSDSYIGGGSPSSEKLTKITTLRLAMKYISALSQCLQQESPVTIPGTSAESASSDLGYLASGYGDAATDLDALLLESDDDSLYFRSDLSDTSSFTPPDFSDYRVITPPKVFSRRQEEPNPSVAPNAPSTVPKLTVGAESLSNRQPEIGGPTFSRRQW